MARSAPFSSDRFGFTASLARFSLLLLWGLCLLASPPASAQTAGQEKRVALIVGNAHYRHAGKLVTPPNDVKEVARRLKMAGFLVFEGLDLDKRQLVALIRRFLQELDKNTVALFYYSGHAVQVSGDNYLIPVDARLASAYDLEQETFKLNNLLKYMKSLSSSQLVFLDACRNNPFKGRHFLTGALTRGASSSGLAAMEADAGTLISYSTAPGRVAYDGTGRTSPFSGAFARYLLTPATEVRQLLTKVRREVVRQTKGAQLPWDNSALLNDFFFVRPRKPPVVKAVHETPVGIGVARADLHLPLPFQKEGGALRVRFTKLPQTGRLLLRNREIGTRDVLAARDLSALRFDARQLKAGAVEVIGYRVDDDWGNKKDGLIIIKATQTIQPIIASAALKRAGQVQLASLRKDLIPGLARAFQPPIGVGPVPLRVKLPGAIPKSARVEILHAPKTGQLRLNGRILASGASFKLARLQELRYKPVVGSQGKPVRADLVVATASARSEILPVKFVPKIHECDRLAGQPFDLQGVAPGVYAHHLKAKKAKRACLIAMADYPRTPRFIFQLGRAELALGEPAKARTLFKLAAKLGHIRADHLLGGLWATGANGKVEQRKANAHFAVAALKGDPYAIYSYGKRIFYGTGVKQDRVKGLSYMLQAAEMGHTFAMNELNRIFRLGTGGVKKDEKRALRFAMASALRDDIYGYNNLALHFLNGIGVKQDDTKALAWFLKAYKGGHPEAANNIGRMYHNGWGVPENVEIAAGWYEKAALRGSLWGATNRADLAANGPASVRSDLLAGKYYALAIALERDRPAKKARQSLRKLATRKKRLAIQYFLNQLGYRTQNHKGRYGQASRKAIARFIHDHKGDKANNDSALLISLARSWWRKNKPRFDLF